VHALSAATWLLQVPCRPSPRSPALAHCGAPAAATRGQPRARIAAALRGCQYTRTRRWGWECAGDWSALWAPMQLGNEAIADLKGQVEPPSPTVQRTRAVGWGVRALACLFCLCALYVGCCGFLARVRVIGACLASQLESGHSMLETLALAKGEADRELEEAHVKSTALSEEMQVPSLAGSQQITPTPLAPLAHTCTVHPTLRFFTTSAPDAHTCAHVRVWE
jgi:hypothetical protein